MKILDPDENDIGEVCVKGPMVMQGYYQMPEETKEVFTEDGWLKTGDLGKLDNENYLYLAGRAKNMIVTEGGKNVYPEEIENEFQLYTDIDQITVQGYIMDKETKSEGIEALVYPSDDLLKRVNILRGDLHYADAVLPLIQEIIDKVNKLEQPYARISKITILDEALEMTTTKKVKRKYS
jgi:long-chain acyl-CoA synthetase